MLHQVLKILIFNSLFLLFIPGAQAFEIYGSLQSHYLHYLEEIDGRDSSRPYFILSAKNRGDLGEYFNYKLSPYFIYDGWSEVDQQKTLFDVDEVYIEFVKNSLSIKLGWLQYNWGVTEGFNPAAVMQSYRVWNPLELKALASPSIHTTWSSGTSQLELVAVFKRRPSQLPQSKSRWLPDEYYDSEIFLDDEVIVLPSNPSYHYLSDVELNNARDWNYGLRYFKTLGSLDASIFFFEGAAPVPLVQTGFSVNSIGVIDGKNAFFLAQDIFLTPIYYRLQTTGMTLVYQWGRSIFRYAGHYQNEVGDNASIYDWQMAHVFAWELSPLASGDLIVLMEHSKVKRANDFNTTVTSLGKVFDEAYLLGLRYEFNRKWSGFVSALYDNISKDQVHTVNISGKINDKFSTGLSWLNIEENDKSSALAGYTKNDQIRFQVDFFF